MALLPIYYESSDTKEPPRQCCTGRLLISWDYSASAGIMDISCSR